MSQLEPNDFEERWRKAFEEASETPSDGLWDRVEHQLPPERPVGLPLFWVGIILLFLGAAGGLGWWMMQKQSTAVAPLAHAIHTGKTPAVSTPASAAQQSADTKAIRNTNDEIVGSTSSTKKSSPATVPLMERVSSNEKIRDTERAEAVVSTNGLNRKSRIPKNQELASTESSSVSAKKTESIRKNQSSESVSMTSVPVESVPVVQPETPSPLLTRTALMDLDLAKSRNWSLIPVSATTQPPTVSPLIQKPFRMQARFWLTASASMISFNPVVSVKHVQIPSANSVVSNNFFNASNATPTSQANFAQKDFYLSYQVELLGGVRLSKRWFVESGLQFLRGHSTLNNNIILIDLATNMRNSAYTSMLDQKSYQQSPNSQTTMAVAYPNSFRYTFEYLSVPVSVGYRIQPDKRLNYFVSAGMTGDFFLKNILVDNSIIAIPTATYGPKDGIYRNVTVSTAAALGANYQIFRGTSIQLKTFVKKSVVNGLNGETNRIHPLTLGVGLGIRKDL